MVDLHAFSVSVMLYKVTAGGAPGRVIQAYDLTPYLGDGGSVRMATSVRSLVGNVFSVSFSDRIPPDLADSIYAYVSPMDLIEIRASRKPWKYQGQKLPLLMRGFVRRVRRPRAMQGEGAPMQTVVIEGKDCGRLLETNQILYPLLNTKGELYLDQFPLQAQFGISPVIEGVGDFVREVVTKIINPKINQMAAFSTGAIKPFLTSDITVAEGTFSPFNTMTFQGSVADLLAAARDAPWNEMFVRTTEAGPSLVFRPVPFRDLNGKLIMDGAADPGLVGISDRTVSSCEVGRSDDGAANYFWVPPGAAALDSEFTAAIAYIDSQSDVTYANNRPEIFGLRLMSTSSYLLPTGFECAPSRMVTDLKQQVQQLTGEWITKRATDLKMLNRDNVVFESGALTCMGREELACGQELEVAFGATTLRGYMPAVEHTIMPTASWTCSVQLERGTSYVDRAKMAGIRPGWAEGRPGVYAPRRGRISVSETAGSS
ncbi:hypothetical protein [Novacetimonas hansenii]|uniref:hypothetical protein n=1 Tax=Novacetimonas hansenii TaxID=436 RepID=UPI00094FFCB7|nr:hypothetical protein [Novacetimonas hansenii]